MTKQEFLSMPLKRKIGQTAVVRHRPVNPELGDAYDALLAEYGFGAFFIGAEVIRPGREGRADVERATRALRERSAIPPLFCADAEAGFRMIVGDEEAFPDLMALGAADDLQLCYDFGRATALECRAAGIDWSFAPVADLNLNWLNPIVNVRSMGDDVERVLPLLLRVVAGMQENGLAATAKHFPGDGVDCRDQHLCMTVNSLAKEEWQARHGRVFRALIDAGVMAVMPGHIALPAWQTKVLPATLSSELLTDLLKGEMNFSGVVVSDALEMGGFRQVYFSQTYAELECFKAGADMLLWPSRDYFAAMERALLAGEIPLSRLDDALGRIYDLKEKLGAFDRGNPPALTPQQRRFADDVSERMGEESVTLLRNREGLLPVRPERVGRILLLALATHPAAREKLGELANLFRARGIEVDEAGDGNALTEERLAAADLAICASALRPHEPLGFLDFGDAEIAGILGLLRRSPQKLVVVSFGSPYVADIYFQAAPCCVNAYSNVASSRRAFVRALFGEIPFAGTSPVRPPSTGWPAVAGATPRR